MIELLRSPQPGCSHASPGSWWISPVHGSAAPAGAVSVRCPKCLRCAVLRTTDAAGNHEGHTVSDDGSVSPSVVCPYAPCDWHEFVRLAGWPLKAP